MRSWNATRRKAALPVGVTCALALLLRRRRLFRSCVASNDQVMADRLHFRDLYSALTSDTEPDLPRDEDPSLSGDELADQLIELLIATDGVLAALRLPGARCFASIEPH